MTDGDLSLVWIMDTTGYYYLPTYLPTSNKLKVLNEG